MNTPSIKLTYAGLLAGDAYLQANTEEFDFYGGQIVPGLHVEFVKSLLQAVFQASGIAIEMPSRPWAGQAAGRQVAGEFRGRHSTAG
jgi:hypothetical protein